MQELIQAITEMHFVQNKTRASVDNHISKIIDEMLGELGEMGFPYEEGLDIAIEYALFRKCYFRGRQKAKQQIDHTIIELMMNDDFPV